MALAVWAWIHGARQARERREALARWASRHGWNFDPGQRADLDEALPQFSCFRQGSNRYAYNVVEGRVDDLGLVACDYHYETYTTDSKGRRTTHHHHFSAVALETGLRFTPLAIRPEHWFDKVAEFFGWDDIDFESAEFSRAFHVKCQDKRYAFDLIPQETMEFLLASPRFTIEVATPVILVRAGKRFSVPEFAAALDVARGFLGRIPPDVRAALRLRVD